VAKDFLLASGEGVVVKGNGKDIFAGGRQSRPHTDQVLLGMPTPTIWPGPALAKEASLAEPRESLGAQSDLLNMGGKVGCPPDVYLYVFCYLMGE
jgi:hypothetical protein